jgi:5,10-methylenetetrahydromethanopterin reductase
VERIQQIAGWPAKPEDIKKAMVLVPDSLAATVCAAGTTAEVASKFEEYHEAGIRVPVLNPLGDHKLDTVKALAKAFA